MAKQTFTTGSVLTAAQMNSLQANDYNQTVSQKIASYVLVAADAGTRIEMNAAGATTVTVNTGLFTAGDTLVIQNIGAGTCTVTAGTATVNKATNASLALAQYQGGTLYFVSPSSSIFFPFDVGSAGSNSITLLSTTTLSGASTTVSSISTSYTDLWITVDDVNASGKYFQWSDATGSYNRTGIRCDGASETNAFTGGMGFSAMSTPLTLSSSANRFQIYINDYTNTTEPKLGQWQGYYVSTYGALIWQSFYSARTAAIDSLTFSVDTGSFSGGTVKIYGVK